MQVHGYPYSERASTFILEMHEDVWLRAGFGSVAAEGLAPGQSDEASIEMIRGLCADVLGGHRLFANNSRWVSFTTVRCQAWRHRNVVLLGDAAHTAHFSIGSGTKLAMEDALALAACLHEQRSVEAALTAYEAERRPVVTSTQRAAQASLEWFENIGQYTDQDPPQFAFNIVTRSRRVTYDNLRLRDPEFAAGLDLPLRSRPGRILLHGHCHQKSMGLLPATVSLLSRIPSATIVDLDAGCCGLRLPTAEGRPERGGVR